jgi:hypothetical protein
MDPFESYEDDESVPWRCPCCLTVVAPFKAWCPLCNPLAQMHDGNKLVHLCFRQPPAEPEAGEEGSN